MQHQQALATKASERYLLGEMSELERFAFEAHYFDCPSCADDVRTGAALARGIKAVCAEDASLRPHTAVVQERPRRGWLSWLSPAALVPSTAAIALGCVAAWQGLGFDSVLALGELTASAFADCLACRRPRRGAGADRPPGPTGIGALPRCQRRRPRSCPYLRSGRSGRRHRLQQANHGSRRQASPLVVFLPTHGNPRTRLLDSQPSQPTGRRDCQLPLLRTIQLRNSMAEPELHPRRHVFRGHSSGVAAHIRRPEKHTAARAGLQCPAGHGRVPPKQCGGQNSTTNMSPMDQSPPPPTAIMWMPATAWTLRCGKVAFDAVPTETRVTASVQDLEILGRVHVGLAAMGLISRSAEGTRPTHHSARRVSSGRRHASTVRASRSRLPRISTASATRSTNSRENHAAGLSPHHAAHVPAGGQQGHQGDRLPRCQWHGEIAPSCRRSNGTARRTPRRKFTDTWSWFPISARSTSERCSSPLTRAASPWCASNSAAPMAAKSSRPTASARRHVPSDLECGESRHLRWFCFAAVRRRGRNISTRCLKRLATSCAPANWPRRSWPPSMDFQSPIPGTICSFTGSSACCARRFFSTAGAPKRWSRNSTNPCRQVRNLLRWPRAS